MAEHEAREERIAKTKERGDEQVEAWNPQQEDYIEALQGSIDRALAAQLSEEEPLADEARQDARENGKLIICFGPPGAGKPAVTFHMIDHTLAEGGKVLMALPTAQLAVCMRSRYGDRIDIDTCAASFGSMDEAIMPEHGRWPALVCCNF